MTRHTLMVTPPWTSTELSLGWQDDPLNMANRSTRSRLDVRCQQAVFNRIAPAALPPPAAA
jgi:hypothetical protein